MGFVLQLWYQLVGDRGGYSEIRSVTCKRSEIIWQNSIYSLILNGSKMETTDNV